MKKQAIVLLMGNVLDFRSNSWSFFTNLLWWCRKMSIFHYFQVNIFGQGPKIKNCLDGAICV